MSRVIRGRCTASAACDGFPDTFREPNLLSFLASSFYQNLHKTGFSQRDGIPVSGNDTLAGLPEW